MAEQSGGQDMPPKQQGKNPLDEFANFIPERPTGLGGVKITRAGESAAPAPTPRLNP